MPEMQREPSRDQNKEAARRFLERHITQQAYQPTAKEFRKQQKQQEEWEKAQQKAETERTKREAAQLIESHFQYLCDQWASFQRQRHDLPPTLLPLEEADDLLPFRAYIAGQSQRIIAPQAFERLEKQIESKAREGKEALRSFKNALRRESIGRRIYSLFDFGIDRLLLDKCVISVSAPKIGVPDDKEINDAQKFLRSEWSAQLARSDQSILSIHKCAGKTIIHIGSGAFGSVFITVPQSLEPEEFAKAFISRIKREARPFFSKSGTVVAIDGAYQNLNLGKIFLDSRVVRSINADIGAFHKNLITVIEREGPTARNSTVLLGVPRTESELRGVFEEHGGEGADWDLWSDVGLSWETHAKRQGFAPSPSASAGEVLDALTSSKNVIIVIAHGDERKIVLPVPPPKSELSTDQLLSRKAEIASNRPLVYLFCCETAEISGLKNFANVLLECGAAGVVAPQVKIDAVNSIKFFDQLVADERNPNRALEKIFNAQKRSGYQEMEVWLG
jgi:hypothetical protein